MDIKETIAAMLTENTGTHMLDSGGANGRAWQQNKGMTVATFEAQASATAEVYVREYQGELTAEVLPCVSCFHLLTGGVLELDSLCKRFNSISCDDRSSSYSWHYWSSDLCGVSTKGFDWLMFKGFEIGEGFNTYNWGANHSAVMQGTELTRDGEWGEEKYLLLQIHGGADVRGGYTDAKLFKISDHAELYNVLTEDCGFSDDSGEKSLSWHGEWINSDGGCADDNDLLEFALACGASLENPSVMIKGDAYLDF